jgi:hypothetical protein
LPLFDTTTLSPVTRQPTFARTAINKAQRTLFDLIIVTGIEPGVLGRRNSKQNPGQNAVHRRNVESVERGGNP